MTEGIDVSALPSGPGCVECEATGGWWFHLRRCAQCGHVGCCDSSPGQHATSHFRTSGHAWMRSYEPGEAWFFNFETEQGYEGPHLADPQHHPAAQTTPGPADRVPADWQDQLN